MRKPSPPPQIIDLTITHLGRSGDGVAVHDGETIFVPYALPGEKVQAAVQRRHKQPASGKIVQLHTSAAERRTAPCRHFGTCGGCGLQHLSTGYYTDYKRGLVLHELERAGVTAANIHPTRTSPEGARRRVVYSARKFKDGNLSVGFNERGAHWLVDVQQCIVVKPAIAALLAPLRELLAQLLQPSDKTDIAVTWFPEGLDVVLLGLPRLDWQGRELLANFARANKLARLTVRARKIKDRDPIYEERKPSCTFGETVVYPPAGSFLQATTEGEAAMVDCVYSAIRTYAPAAKRFADLFAGCGTFSGALATLGNVVAVESEGESLNALTHARSPRIFTRAQDLFENPLLPAELNTFDVVLFDPPRAGARAQAEQLAVSQVALVIGISCNAETFARDTKILIDGGYTLRDLTPVDQFLYAPHIEVVGVFTR
jgi:23S rRNA (uracil1939-C5)-methyltransferase